MYNKISNLLGCSERTAKSVCDNITKNIGAQIKDACAEKTEIRTTLTVTDENDKIYTVIMGRGYLVREIHHNGEKIYFAME